MASNPTIMALEQKYIELLERKITSLESADDGDRIRSPKLGRKTSANSITTQYGDAQGSSKDEAPTAQGQTDASVPSRIRFRQRRITKEGLYHEEDATIRTKPEQTKSASTKHAITVLQSFGANDKYSYSIISIDDDCLRALFVHALSHHPDFSHPGKVNLTSLFEPVIHNWSRLNDFANDDRTKSHVAEFHRELDSSFSQNPLKPPNKLKQAASDLKQLLEQVQDTPGFESYFTIMRDMVEKASTISFEYLWTIFAPGELVLSNACMGRAQVFIVKESKDYIIERRRSNDRSWRLECWSYDWNGTFFNRVPVQFMFEDFKGTRSVRSLHCYPLKFHTGEANGNAEMGDHVSKLEKELVKRGQRFRELCLKGKGKQIFEYDGMALSRGTGVRKVTKLKQDDDQDGWSSSGRASNIPQSEQMHAKTQIIKADRVMVDFTSYVQHGPAFTKFPPMGELNFVVDDDKSCKCKYCADNSRLRDNQKLHYDGVDSTTTATWEKTQYLICPPRVLGYHLKGKRWVELDLDRVADISNLQDRSSFESLALAKPQKNLIEHLVRCHASGGNDADRSMTDLMQGKGNGLVILLHGPPGVGKTLTAESVAKATGKPLFSVSVSDIGLKPSEVEHNLEVLFELATTWRAVMLFDEADVFLESRSSNTANLDRNALVSVLLRVLEYYDGILILTTNRIRTFDIAVQSRVNFAITYKNLNEEQKKQIYLNFIRQLNPENTHSHQMLLRWPEQDEWAEEPPFRKLNGRQIRNVLFSAASIAMGDPDDKRLQLEHIKKILKETNNFQVEINGMIELARREAEVGFDNHYT